MALTDEVQKVIEEQIRPALRMDGGDIELVSIEDEGIVRVRLLGACGSCPFSTMTLKMGVEDSLKKAVPQIKEVVAV